MALSRTQLHAAPQALEEKLLPQALEEKLLPPAFQERLLPQAVRASPQATSAHDAAVAAWLWAIAAIVFLMIIVGGATRLTDSGLSITEWRPILGAIPPLSAADWQSAFAKYKEIPEYKLVNTGMSLDDFKMIFWWEWGHRFLGRFIGLAFAVPLATFWALGWLRPGLAPKLVGVLALGGLQGAIGWYMVQSGLVERVDVSQYRLALHLTVAFLILGIVVWLALGLAPDTRSPRLTTLTVAQRRRAWLIVGLVLSQVVLGAFVAGTKAGLAYNTWPLMDGRLVPTGLLTLAPWYVNVTENITAIQFNHRTVAYVVLALALWHAISLARAEDDERISRTAVVLALAVVVQAVLGIATLLLAHGRIPIGLGLAHQGGGAIVWAIAVWHAFRVTRGTVVKVRASA